MNNIRKVAITVLIGAFSVSAFAQDEGHLLVKTVVQKEEVVVEENGEQKVQLVDATKVVPGDEVIYTVTFQNISTDAAENVVITNPIASDLVYVDGSAFGPGSEVLFSVDGGAVFADANELSVTDDDGVVRPARASDFTHIRWQLENGMPPGSQGVARFRAKLQ